MNELPVVSPQPVSTVTSSVYGQDAEFIAGRIDAQTTAIHIQFAVLILVLVFLKVWRRERK